MPWSWQLDSGGCADTVSGLKVCLGFVGRILDLYILKTLVSESIMNIFQCKDGLHIRIVVGKGKLMLLNSMYSITVVSVKEIAAIHLQNPFAYSGYAHG